MNYFDKNPNTKLKKNVSSIYNHLSCIIDLIICCMKHETVNETNVNTFYSYFTPLITILKL